MHIALVCDSRFCLLLNCQSVVLLSIFFNYINTTTHTFYFFSLFIAVLFLYMCSFDSNSHRFSDLSKCKSQLHGIRLQKHYVCFCVCCELWNMCLDFTYSFDSNSVFQWKQPQRHSVLTSPVSIKHVDFSHTVSGK